MTLFEIAGLLLTLAAVLAYLNHKLLRLPPSIGLMLLALLGSVTLLIVGLFRPDWVEPTRHLVESIDFNEALMHGMLGFLLFAGALHVDLADLRERTWVILTLATLGVVTTTALVGGATYGITQLLGLDLPLIYCFIFGSLIAPTDPIAVLAIMNQVGAPVGIETKLAGESLFNDGVGVVVFLALLGVAGLEAHPAEEPATTQAPAHVEPHAQIHSRDVTDRDEKPVLHESIDQAPAEDTAIDWPEVAKLFALEAGGGLLFGLGIGLLGYLMLRWTDDYKTEVLITLAMVAGGYALSFVLHVSGPLAMVVAGLLIGNHGRALAMSETTRVNLDLFWELVDEVLNAVLFVLIGLEVLVLSLNVDYLIAGAIAIPAVLLCRFVAVGGAIGVLRNVAHDDFTPHAVKVLTWAGLRGGISVALALAFKQQVDGHGSAAEGIGELILTMTYLVVAFSIIVQGLTVAPLLRACGLAGKGATPLH